MNWDSYFLTVCNAVASKSPCLSRQIGAILVRDHSIVSTGYNGPARGYPHCQHIVLAPGKISSISICPRHVKGYASGEGLVECPAAHAEGNCIANAARIGASTINSTLYMNTQIPCKDCMILLVNAGICEVVVTDLTPYHKMSIDIARYGNIKMRRFQI
jgi:dCMP deaminase